MRLVALSDTHGQHGKVIVPEGDILVYAGDFCTHGFSFGEVFSFRDWFKSQPHKYKILVAGNHDRLMEMRPELSQEFAGDESYYLWDSGILIEGLYFWGSPYTPWFNNWAFNEHANNMHRHWDLIPENTDVLITHGPPKGIRDGLGAESLGDPQLLEAVNRLWPQVHIFGHIHAGYGSQISDKLHTQFYNVAICNEKYKVANPCTVIDID